MQRLLHVRVAAAGRRGRGRKKVVVPPSNNNQLTLQQGITGQVSEQVTDQPVTAVGSPHAGHLQGREKLVTCS